MATNWIERASREGTPLIDGSIVTYVWQGKTAPRLIADFNAWEHGGADMQPAGKGVWIVQQEFPSTAYSEYGYLLGEERLEDPFNKRKVSNGMGKYNHYFYMPGAYPSPYLKTRRGVPRGTVTSEIIQGDAFVVGGKRKVYFYQPPTTEPSPLLLVWDGQDYYRRALITRIVDNLIYEGRIRPVALAMVEHGRQARMIEYGCCDITVGFALVRLLEIASQRLNLVDLQVEPGAYGVLGASMGGVMALYTGLRAPNVFGKVLSQSGAFSLGENDLVVWDLVRSADPQALKVWMDVGHYEWLYETNRRMAALLEARGFSYSYHEYYGGHNYTSWRNELADGLIYTFGTGRN